MKPETKEKLKGYGLLFLLGFSAFCVALIQPVEATQIEVSVCAYDVRDMAPIRNITVNISNTTYATTNTTGEFELCTDWMRVTQGKTYDIYIDARDATDPQYAPFRYRTISGVRYQFDTNFEGFDFYLYPVTPVHYYPHYVTFKVHDFWMNPINHVDVVLYPLAGISSVNGDLYNYQDELDRSTEGDGSVSFGVYPSIKHNVTFTNASEGIDQRMYLYPRLDTYYVMVDREVRWFSFDSFDINHEINITLNYTEINATYANITVTYHDNLTQTNNLTIYLNQTNTSDYWNQTQLQVYRVNATSTVLHNFTVTPYIGESYFVHYVSNHTTFGVFERQYDVSFADFVDVGFPDEFYPVFAFAIILLSASIFTATTAPQGALVVCLVSWIMYGFGWLSILGITLPIAISLATIVSIIAIILERGRKEGHL